MNTGLIGQPTAWSQDVAAVGPTVDAGSIAVADSANGLRPGSGYDSILDISQWHQDDGRLARAEPSGAAPLANRATGLATAAASPRLNAKATSARADERALAQANLLIDFGSRLKSWLAPVPSTAETDGVRATSLGPRALVQNEGAAGLAQSGPDRSKRSAATAQADVGTALSLMTVGVVVYRFRRPLERWWQQGGRRAIGGSTSNKPFWRGPHPMTARTRAAARPRAPRSAR